MAQPVHIYDQTESSGMSRSSCPPESLRLHLSRRVEETQDGSETEIDVENSPIETTIAELLPKLPAGEATQAQTDYADLKRRLTAMASRLRNENSLRVAVVLPTSDPLMLDDSNVFDRWWDRLYEQSKTELVTYVRRQLGVRLPKRPDLRELDPEVFKNSDAFKHHVWWRTWTKAKGPMWEWSILLAMSDRHPTDRRRLGDSSSGSGKRNGPYPCA